MLIVSFKLQRRKMILGAMIVLLIGASFFAIVLKPNTTQSFNVAQKSSEYNFRGIKTNEERIAFLAQFGWEVAEQPIEIMEVQIPEEFDQVYLKYNELQKQLKLDLQKYTGKRAKRYTYIVTNYPKDTQDEIRANILMHKDRVIAGDIMSTALDGFMHSLLQEKAQQQEQREQDKEQNKGEQNKQ